MAAAPDDLTHPDLAIAEKYEGFVSYLYPILSTMPRRHHVLRDVVLRAMLEPIESIYHAARSRQVSRLHAVDAGLATLRFHLRFLFSLRLIGPRQHRTALALLAPVGAMLGAWQRKLGGQSGK